MNNNTQICFENEDEKSETMLVLPITSKKIFKHIENKEVFCMGCSYFMFMRYTCGKEYKKVLTPIEELIVYADCKIKNKNNDCKDFKQKYVPLEKQWWEFWK